MEAHAHYTLVGLVVIALTSALVTALVWLSKHGEEGDSQYYTVYFEHFSLSGLQVDSAVTMRGIRIGSVKSFQISPKNIERVKVVLKVQANTPVKADALAVIQRNLLTGLANIELTNSTKEAPLLTHVAANEDFPVISEGQPQFEKIQSSLPELLEHVNEIVKNGAHFFSAENREKATSVLSNLELITSKLAKSEGQLATTLEAVAGLADDTRALVKVMETHASALSKDVTVTSQILAREAAGLRNDLSQTAHKVGTTVENYENPGAVLFGGGERGPGE